MKDKFISIIGKYSSDENYNINCWNEIYDKYSSDSRHYHNLDHLKSMFSELDRITSKIKNLDFIEFSIFYHDIIYNPLKSDNEHQSSLIFKKRLFDTSFDQIEHCMAQIEATKEHKLSDDGDTNFLLDLDLSILGSDLIDKKNIVRTFERNISCIQDLCTEKEEKRCCNTFST